LSNYGDDEIEDCLQKAFDGEYDGLRVTIGDVEYVGEKLIPKEVGLTDPDDYLAQERLDYIFVLNK
jgi:hypothetical protein